MTREERQRAIAEAIAWMREDGGKFPGWGEDKMAVEDKLATALLESLLLAYPQIRLVPLLAACRVHWLPRGATTPRAWCRRIQNWARCGAEWGDPLISGKSREPRATGCESSAERRPVFGGDEVPGPRPRRASLPARPIAPREAMGAPPASDEVRRAEMAKMKRMAGG